MEDTPRAHNYFAYQFTPIGIPYDINTTPTFVRDIYTIDPPQGIEKIDEDTDTF